ncbi:MAG: ABC transporter permease [Propionibacteriaceae bacterium]|nr:ABC transporter permease [Propionibacteriaceae bacterium]
MIATLRSFFRENWLWRSQIWSLAVTEIQKQVRGAAFGWLWIFATPTIYVLVFAFALSTGIRGSSGPVNGVPFLVWLTVGLIPWFFMSDMLVGGSNVYRRYPYLVNRLRFPIPVISSFFAMAHFIIFLMILLIVFVVMAVMRWPLTIYAIQLPFLALVMYFFWTIWSMMASPLAAISKDFHNLIRALTTPLFWLSGIIFNISNVKQEWLRWILSFNPVTFFATSFRATLCDGYWIWSEPRLIYPFLGVFLVMFILAIRIQHRLGTEVADVL